MRFTCREFNQEKKTKKFSLLFCGKRGDMTPVTV